MSWAPPSPLACDHCGWPVVVVASAHGQYVHKGGMLYCNNATGSTMFGDLTVRVRGHWSVVPTRGAA